MGFLSLPDGKKSHAEFTIRYDALGIAGVTADFKLPSFADW